MGFFNKLWNWVRGKGFTETQREEEILQKEIGQYEIPKEEPQKDVQLQEKAKEQPKEPSPPEKYGCGFLPKRPCHKYSKKD